MTSSSQAEAEKQAIAMLREQLGVTAIERRMEFIEAGIQRAFPAEGEAPQPGGPQDLLANPMVQNVIGIAGKALEKWLGGGESEDTARRRTLFDAIQKKVEDRVWSGIDQLADSIVSGKGLIVEKPVEETDKIGKPDGRGLPE